MTRINIPLGRIFGIPIRMDYSWLLIFGLLIWLLASSYYPAQYADLSSSLYWVMGAATAVLFFVSVLLHELGHVLATLRHGVPVRSITLFFFGGVAHNEAEPPSAVGELIVATAGPLVSLILAVLCLGLEMLVVDIEPLLALAMHLAYINLALALFNLIPGHPLDGGRILRAILWATLNDIRRASLVVTNVGRFVTFGFVALGIMQMFRGNFGEGLGIAVVGWYLDHVRRPRHSRQ